MMPASHTLRVRPEPTVRMRPPPPAMTVRQHVAVTMSPPAPATPACLNCELPLIGKFCHACGQAAKTPARITLGAILHELPHAILHLEHALPHTIVALLRRPGHTMREYLGGKRVHTYSPFTLLFLTAGLLGLVMVTLKLQGPVVVQADNDVGPRLTAAIFKYNAWFRLALLPLHAIGPAIVLRRRTGLHYGEQVVAAAMVTAGSVMLSLAALPLRWLAYKWSAGAGALVTGGAELSTTLYVLWAYAQLQDDGKKRDAVMRWLRSIASLFAAGVVYMVVMIAAVVLLLVGKKLHLI
ncbi:MAG: DUF3667 domain-containing protein [Labilithrix sp.]|nr:DUF3667 domain-containing protein [Labilithrix sp.]MCW5812049.1 DUF3667 domain-containing protein [Labilithrix sp.]